MTATLTAAQFRLYVAQAVAAHRTGAIDAGTVRAAVTDTLRQMVRADPSSITEHTDPLAAAVAEIGNVGEGMVTNLEYVTALVLALADDEDPRASEPTPEDEAAWDARDAAIGHNPADWPSTYGETPQDEAPGHFPGDGCGPATVGHFAGDRPANPRPPLGPHA